MQSFAFTATAAISASLSRVTFAEALLRHDLIVIDGMGYLPFSQAGAHDVAPSLYSVLSSFGRLDWPSRVG